MKVTCLHIVDSFPIILLKLAHLIFLHVVRGVLFTIETCINLCARYFAVPRWQKDSTVNQQLSHIFIDYFNRSYSRLFSSQLKTSDFIHFTRQHSSRMCTAHLSLYRGGCLCLGASPCTETPPPGT